MLQLAPPGTCTRVFIFKALGRQWPLSGPGGAWSRPGPRPWSVWPAGAERHRASLSLAARGRQEVLGAVGGCSCSPQPHSWGCSHPFLPLQHPPCSPWPFRASQRLSARHFAEGLSTGAPAWPPTRCGGVGCLAAGAHAISSEVRQKQDQEEQRVGNCPSPFSPQPPARGLIAGPESRRSGLGLGRRAARQSAEAERLVATGAPMPADSLPQLLRAIPAPADQTLLASIYFCPHFHLLLSLPQALVKAGCWGLINLAGSVNSDQLK